MSLRLACHPERSKDLKTKTASIEAVFVVSVSGNRRANICVAGLYSSHAIIVKQMARPTFYSPHCNSPDADRSCSRLTAKESKSLLSHKIHCPLFSTYSGSFSLKSVLFQLEYYRFYPHSGRDYYSNMCNSLG